MQDRDVFNMKYKKAVKNDVEWIELDETTVEDLHMSLHLQTYWPFEAIDHIHAAQLDL